MERSAAAILLLYNAGCVLPTILVSSSVRRVKAQGRIIPTNTTFGN